MQTYCDHSVTTQSCTSIERNCVLYGSANSSPEFTLWQTVELQVVWDVENVTPLQWNRYISAMSYGWFTQSSVSDNPCTCVCHPYDLDRLYLFHYSNVILAPSRLTSPVMRLFVHVFLLLDDKGNSKTPLTVRFRGIHRWLVEPLYKGQVMR